MKYDNLPEEPIHHESYDLGYEQGRADAIGEIDVFIKSFPSLLCHTTVIEEWERYKEQLKEHKNGV